MDSMRRDTHRIVSAGGRVKQGTGRRKLRNSKSGGSDRVVEAKSYELRNLGVGRLGLV